MPRYGQWYLIGGARVHMCGSKPLPQPCSVCQGMSGYLCDYPLSSGKTCDRPLCESCRIKFGARLDYCPEHLKEGKKEDAN